MLRRRRRIGILREALVAPLEDDDGEVESRTATTTTSLVALLLTFGGNTLADMGTVICTTSNPRSLVPRLCDAVGDLLCKLGTPASCSLCATQIMNHYYKFALPRAFHDYAMDSFSFFILHCPFLPFFLQGLFASLKCWVSVESVKIFRVSTVSNALSDWVFFFLPG